MIDGSKLPHDVSASALYNEVTYWAQAFGWAPGQDVQYIVFNPPGQGSSFLNNGGLCGRHSDQSGYIFSDIADYSSTPENCGGANATQAITLVSSHEYAEAATDPYLGTGWTGACGGSCEVGDGPANNVCNLVAGPTIGGSLVQEIWDNASQACQGASTQGGMASRIVGWAVSSSHGGYWNVGSDGSIFYYDGAPFEGTLRGTHLNAPIVGMAGTPDGNGYWLVGADGGVFNFGDAAFYGSKAGQPLNKPIVGIASSIDGRGYWLVGADGGLFNFGDAGYYGSLPGEGITPNGAIVGIDRTLNSAGYWMVGTDGGVFNFGSAVYYGSLPGSGIHPNAPISGMFPTSDSAGYWIGGQDGGVFNYGDAAFEGAAGSYPAQRTIVGIFNTGGDAAYAFVANDQTAYDYGTASLIPN